MDLPIIREKNRKTNFPVVWPLFRPFLYKIARIQLQKFQVMLLFILHLLCYAAEYVASWQPKERRPTKYCFGISNCPPPPPPPPPQPNYLLFVRCPEFLEQRSASCDVSRGPDPSTSSTLQPSLLPHSASQAGVGGARGSGSAGQRLLWLFWFVGQWIEFWDGMGGGGICSILYWLRS